MIKLKTAFGQIVEAEVLSKHEQGLEVVDGKIFLMAPGSGPETLEVWIVRVEGAVVPLLILGDTRASLLYNAPFDVEVLG